MSTRKHLHVEFKGFLGWGRREDKFLQIFGIVTVFLKMSLLVTSITMSICSLDCQLVGTVR